MYLSKLQFLKKNADVLMMCRRHQEIISISLLLSLSLSLADFTLHPFAVVNPSHDNGLMLGPVSPPRESLKRGGLRDMEHR